jgi:preprotein translocase subunit SecD
MRSEVAALGLAACLAAMNAAWPVEADTVLSLSVEDVTLDILPASIAEMDISESGDITDVFFRLMPGATEDFARFTGEGIGRTMTLSVCGATLMAPVVRERIDSGTIYLAGTTMVRAEAMRALWHGRASCDTLDPEVFEHGQ